VLFVRGLSGEWCFWLDTLTWVGEEGWSPMTETPKGMSSMPKDAEKTAGLGEMERAAVRELVKAARARGEDLTGSEGLLKVITATVLEAALEEEMTEHLGHEKHHAPPGGAGNVRNGTRPKTVLTDAAGHVEIEVPRDGAGTFEPVIVAKRQRRLSDVDAVANLGVRQGIDHRGDQRPLP